MMVARFSVSSSRNGVSPKKGIDTSLKQTEFVAMCCSRNEISPIEGSENRNSIYALSSWMLFLFKVYFLMVIIQLFLFNLSGFNSPQLAA